MPLVAWIVLGLLVWTALGAGVAVLVGRMARQRDRQVPDPGTGFVPAPRDGRAVDDGPSRSPVSPAGRTAGRRPPV